MTETDAPDASLPLYHALDREQPVAFWLGDPSDGGSVCTTDSFSRLWDCPEDALAADPLAFIDQAHPDDRPKLETLLDAAIAGDGASVDVRVGPDGAVDRHVRVLAAPVGDGDRTSVGLLTHDVTDVTEHYRRAVEGSNDLIVAVDDAERYLFANQTYCDYHGVDRQAIIGRSLADVFDAETYEQIATHVREVLSGEEVGYRMTRVHPNLGERIFDISYYPLRDGDEVTGAVGALRDVTDREERTRHLEVLDRVLRHNLRNDLTIVRGYGEALLDDDRAELARYGEHIVTSVDDLLRTSEKSRIITSLLIEQPPLHEVDVADAVAGVVDAAPGPVRLVGDLPDDATVLVVPSLEEALDELVRNALEHHDGDDPTVEVTVERAGDQVVVQLTDDGPGLPGADRTVLEHGMPPSGTDHGSGIGCWLVYWTAQRSRGRVAVEAREPRGTLVRVSLPAAEPAG